jgi:hypothetical protein
VGGGGGGGASTAYLVDCVACINILNILGSLLLFAFSAYVCRSVGTYTYILGSTSGLTKF